MNCYLGKALIVLAKKVWQTHGRRITRRVREQVGFYEFCVVPDPMTKAARRRPLTNEQNSVELFFFGGAGQCGD